MEILLKDVLDDFTTIEDAKNSYGVVINPDTMTVDVDATALLRVGK